MSRERKDQRSRMERVNQMATDLMGKFQETNDRLWFDEAEPPDDLKWPWAKAVAGFLLLALAGIVLFGIGAFIWELL